jgi:hypothetical protein
MLRRVALVRTTRRNIPEDTILAVECLQYSQSIQQRDSTSVMLAKRIAKVLPQGAWYTVLIDCVHSSFHTFVSVYPMACRLLLIILDRCHLIIVAQLLYELHKRIHRALRNRKQIGQ